MSKSKVIISQQIRMAVLKKIVERSAYYETLGFKDLAFISSVPLKNSFK